MDLSGEPGLPCLHSPPPAHQSNKEHSHKVINAVFIFIIMSISCVCPLFNPPAANICSVPARGFSPAGVKAEPDEDDGFRSSPQRNKASKWQCDNKELVSDTLNWKQSLVQIQPAVNLSNTLPLRFLYQPKKTKTEHDKKAKKRKHDHEEEDEDEVRRVRQKLSKSGLHVALEILICSLHLRTSNPKRRPETKRDLRGRNPRKKRRRSGNGETRSSSPQEPAGAGTVS